MSLKTPEPMKTPPIRRDAVQTRSRIPEAARKRFSNFSYENAGMCDIAADAGVDAALVNRYFGTKEGLFAEVIAGGFLLEEHLPAKLSDLGTWLAGQVLDATEEHEADEFDAVRVLLRAAGNPAIAPLVSECFRREFVTPLAKLLSGRNRGMRAALIASCVIGLATMRHGLASPELSGDKERKAAAIAAAAIQACVGSP